MELTAVDVLSFHCPCCYAGLTVPVAMAGIVGPCPNCGESIQAPEPRATIPASLTVPVPAPSPATSRMQLPPPDGAHEEPVRPIAPIFPKVSLAESLRRTAPVNPATTPTPAQGSDWEIPDRFSPRKAIPESTEPPDDSWRPRAEQKRRRSRRWRKADKLAETVMESRGFRLARVALLILTGGMAAGLYLYLKDHNFTFQTAGSAPKGGPAVTAPAPAPVGATRQAEFTNNDPESPFTEPLAPAEAPASIPTAATDAPPGIR